LDKELEAQVSGSLATPLSKRIRWVPHSRYILCIVCITLYSTGQL